MVMSLPGYSCCRRLSIVSGLGGIAVGSIVGVAEGVGELGGSVVAIDGPGSFVTGGVEDIDPEVQAASIAALISSMPKNKVIQVCFTDLGSRLPWQDYSTILHFLHAFPNSFRVFPSLGGNGVFVERE